eukprot:SRR837773.18865.p1 GENE.SRR837773.18865~~SRR837773.18865.p1  ORF type:complete len:679 (-),score=327.35 SRR837773.18865:35-2071(-)
MRFHTEGWIHALLHPTVVFGLPVLWVLGVYGFASYMTTRRAFKVKRAMQVYNVVQIVLCSYMVWGLMPSFPNIFGLDSEHTKAGEWFVFVHYLSKFLDWFDTMWIIMKKNRQQLSFLHVYHHATIGMVWGFLLRSGIGNGTTRYGAWINSLTHVIMYSHYLWTSFGLKNPFKRYITCWQIGQFYSCLLHAFVVRFMEHSDSWKFAWLQIGYQMTMIYLFSLKMSWVPSCTPDLSTKDEDALEKLAMASKRYIIIRGEAYDVTEFEHPGGKHMLDLAVGRDATIMFESMHARMEIADSVLKKLPKAASVEELEKLGHTFDRPKETWATPSESELYQVIRKRVIKEILEPLGKTKGSTPARGVPAWHVASVVAGWATAATLLTLRPSVWTGALTGLSMCWVGLAIQHTANHGGLSKNTTLGYLMGLLDDIIPGGSSMVWRYHHQVSHHTYCNDVVLDQDAHSSFPMIRMDHSQKVEWYHRYQWIYGPLSFCLLWASIHMQDLQCLLDMNTFLVKFRGSTAPEVVLAMILKLVHVGWLYVIPALVNGPRAMLLPWASALSVGSFALASLFIVSHNICDAKQASEPLSKKGDWARYQIETSASWGGRIGSFFTGGLNLQIEHHLFPALPHNLYTDIQKVVMEECAKRKIKYNYYPTLLPNFVDHIKFLHVMGQPAAAAKKAD